MLPEKRLRQPHGKLALSAITQIPHLRQTLRAVPRLNHAIQF
jgi:hypothetical protein